MRILAIDPGNFQSGFILWDKSNRQQPILDKGIIPNESFRILSYVPDVVVCEMIASYGMAVGETVFDTCVQIGVFKEQCQSLKIPFHTLTRLNVKMHICHSPKANDSNIRQALRDRFGKPGTKKDPGILYGVTKDMMAALAVCVTFNDLVIPLQEVM